MRFCARDTAQQQWFFVELGQAADDRKTRIVGNPDDEIQLALQVLRQAFELRTAAGEYQTAFVDVAGDFRREFGQHRTNFFRDTPDDRHRDRVDLAGGNVDGARTASLHVAATHVDLLAGIFWFDRGTEFKLQPFRRLHTNR